MVKILRCPFARGVSGPHSWLTVGSN